MAHVFIVNKRTFKLHLEYMFAGTGAKDVSTEFIFDCKKAESLHDEKMSIGLISDISRVRKGDKIIFFVTGIAKFYGIFEAVSDFFVDPNDDDNYLFQELEKKLTYRILIKSYKIFESGITEYDFLDALGGINHPDEMCWSLIYRKLGGNRGCTMITDAEYILFENRLSACSTLIEADKVTYDAQEEKIIPFDKEREYSGRRIDVVDYLKKNLESKYSNRKAFEHYIQLFVILNLKSENSNIILDSDKTVTWIGNEVMCSVGEHRIDVLAIQEDDQTVNISVIELKDEKIYESVLCQLIGYVKWLKDYIVPFYTRKGKSIIIHPIIISDGCPKSRKSTKNKLDTIERKIRSFNWNGYDSQSCNVVSTRIIHFNNEQGELIF